MRPLATPVLLCAALAGAAACSSDPVSPPAEFAIVMDPGLAGNNQSAEVGTVLPLGLRVLVTKNNIPASGIDVVWAVPPGDGTIGTATTTNAAGIATGIWSMPTTSGVKTATAALSGATGSPVTFQATATPAAADSFAIQAGNNQTVSAGAVAGEPLIVKILDAYHNPVGGVTVAWSLISGDATLSETSTVTGVAGTATISVTAGPTAGPVVIRAIPNSPPGVQGDFSLTIVP